MESSTSSNDEVKKEDDNDEVFADNPLPCSHKQRSNSVIDSIGGSGIVVVGGDGAGESPFASPAGDVTSRTTSLSAPEKEDDNDEVFADNPLPCSHKQRSNSVIDSIGGSGIVVVGGDGAGESPFASPAGDVTSRTTSLSAPETTMYIRECVNPPNIPATASQPDLVERVSDQIDAYVNILDDTGDSSESTNATAQMPVSRDADRYNMDHKNRGKCVVFNHDEFEMTGFDKRKGSTTDVIKLKESFGNLGFDVKVHTNLTFKEVDEELHELSSKTDHTDNDCMCIIVLTHGLQNDLISAKDAAYKTDRLWKPFTADKCPTLAGKPKLFFIQACRGEEIDSGVVLCPRSSVSSTDSVSSYKIPTHADILLAHSSAQGFYTWRNPVEGTWYIECLCEVLNKYGTKMDLLSMLTMTARKVATDYASYDLTNPTRHEKKQMPSLTSLLLRAVYFPPKTNV